MPSLLDIAPLAEEVSVRGASLSVTGVSAHGVAFLLKRFPAIQGLFQGKSLAVEDLFQFGADAVAAIIAAGTGLPGDVKAEAIAATLSIDEQITILESIVRQTLPRGLGPFVERLTALTGGLGVGAEDIKAQGTT